MQYLYNCTDFIPCNEKLAYSKMIYRLSFVTWEYYLSPKDCGVDRIFSWH